MDNFTLVVTTLPLGLIFTLFFGVLAWTRKENALWNQSLGFGFASLASAFLLLQDHLDQMVSVFIFSVLVIAAFQAFNHGFRAIFNVSQLKLNQKYLLAIIFVLIVAFLFIWPSRLQHARVFAFYLIYLLSDLLGVITEKLKRFPKFIYYSFTTLILINIIGGFILLTLFSILPNVQSMSLVDDTLPNRMALIFAIVDFGLWAMGILLVDHERLLERLKINNSELREMALKDPLTGLNNRHFYDAIIHEEMSRSDRYNAPISMVLIDIDYFKRVNDKWGHPIGDDVLRHIAHTIELTIRRSDILLRFGGEEFLILMPETDAKGATEASQKIRLSIQDSPHPVAGKISASFGVAQHQKSESQVHWYKRADQALYQAKEEGRNNVVCSIDTTDLKLDDKMLEWQKSWECGHEVIDEQHKKMVEIGVRLLYLCEDHAEQSLLVSELNNLMDHVVTHFDYEEEIMRQVGYPDSKQHQSIHNSLVQKAVGFKEDFIKGNIKRGAFMSFVLDEVILEHLIKTDYKFYPYLHVLKD